MSDPKKEKEQDDDNEEAPNYTAPKKVGLSDLVNQDAGDESLKKYKEALLGAAASGAVVSPKDDPRRVVVVKMRVLFEARPGGDIVYDLSSKEKLAAMKDTPFVLMEGCKYKIEVTFRVQHDIVSGLKYTNSVYRKGVRVDKSNTMLGSFGPQADAHVVLFPRHGWEEAPSGMLARGDYKAKTQFIDDDNQEHLSYEYAFSIKKGWD